MIREFIQIGCVKYLLYKYMYANRCNEDVIAMLKRKNWNSLHGDPIDIQNFALFNQCVDENERSNIMIDQNKAFVNSVLAAIYSKNKLDYPPIGPEDVTKQQYQTMKITKILEGLLSTYDFSMFGKLNMGNILQSGMETVGTWGMNTARGMNRTISQPRQTMSSTGTSLKRMFGMKNGGKRRRRNTGRRSARRV